MNQPQPGFFTAFMEMLDRTGLSPVRKPHEVMAKERDLAGVLGQVSAFGVDRLPEIEAWIQEPRDHPVRKVNTIIQEIKARLAQPKVSAKTTIYDDEFIIDYYRDILDRMCDEGCEDCDSRRPHYEKVLA